MKKLAVLALGLFVAACSETPTETPTMDAPPLAMSIADAPEVSGIVYRGERPVGLTWWSYASGYRLTLGIHNLYEWCLGAPGAFQVVPFQAVNLDDGVVHMIQGDDAPAVVTPASPSLCGPVVAEDVIATGVADYVRTDNDFNGSRLNAANAFGVAAHGTVTLADGTPMNLSGHIRQRIVKGEWDWNINIVLSGQDN